MGANDPLLGVADPTPLRGVLWTPSRGTSFGRCELKNSEQKKPTHHRPVMTRELLEWLRPRPNGIYVDGTLGSGGHTEAVLKVSSPSGRLIGLDRDGEVVNRALDRFKPWGNRVDLVQGRFSAMEETAGRLGVSGVDGVFLDLGWSSDQMEDPARGFSVHQEGPLDMRLDRRQSLTAGEIVNTYEEGELARVFLELGGERFAGRIAGAIVRQRSGHQFFTTSQLSKTVAHAVPASARHGRRHVATKVFQALRIKVNDEMEELEKGLDAGIRLLREGGRIIIISFHSGEDRVVKQAFRRFEDEGKIRVLTPKPIPASEEEGRENPRSRSARLRVAEKL